MNLQITGKKYESPNINKKDVTSVPGLVVQVKPVLSKPQPPTKSKPTPRVIKNSVNQKQEQIKPTLKVEPIKKVEEKPK